MRVAIVTSRDFNDYKILRKLVNSVISPRDIILIVLGEATGANKLAMRYSHRYNISILISAPKYREYGKEARMVRNQSIVDNCNILIAFPKQNSKEIRHIITIAKAALGEDSVHVFEQ